MTQFVMIICYWSCAGISFMIFISSVSDAVFTNVNVLLVDFFSLMTMECLYLCLLISLVLVYFIRYQNNCTRLLLRDICMEYLISLYHRVTYISDIKTWLCSLMQKKWYILLSHPFCYTESFHWSYDIINIERFKWALFVDSCYLL